jgi:pyruvate oxidase
VLLSEYVVRVLAQRGVRHVFGYPGASIIPLMGAIDRDPEMSWVLMRHEGSAALAASASAKLTGSLAVCLATAGPGATNMATGILDAHLDRAPILALTGLVPSWKQARAGFQDVDAARLFSTLVPHSVACSHPDQLPVLLRNAIGQAEQERTVVHLALPSDIQNVTIDDDDPRFDTGRQAEVLRLQPPPDSVVELVAAELAAGPPPTIAVGARAFGAGAAIEALAERLGAAIVTSLDGKGVIDESHPLSLGALGIFGSPGVEGTRKVLEQATSVLAFGVDDLAPFVTDDSGAQVRDLYQCEPDFTSVTHELRRTRTLCGPLQMIAAGLAERIRPSPGRNLTLDEIEPAGSGGKIEPAGSGGKIEPAGSGGNIEPVRPSAEPTVDVPSDSRYAHPIRVLGALSGLLGPDDVVALDVGDHTVWAAHYLQLRQRQRLLVSKQLGTMGFCLPAVIAAKLAQPSSHVVGICGDGGFQMALGELLTAVQERLELVVVVFDNGILCRVVAQQVQAVGTTLVNPDFVALARACGAEGAVLDGASDPEAVLRSALAHRGGPFLVDVRLDPAVQAPMAMNAGGFVPMHFA